MTEDELQARIETALPAADLDRDGAGFVDRTVGPEELRPVLDDPLRAGLIDRYEVFLEFIFAARPDI